MVIDREIENQTVVHLFFRVFANRNIIAHWDRLG